MTKRAASYYPRNVNQYVPDMEFAADVVNRCVIAMLGAPATLDADGIWDGVAAEATAQEYDSSDYKNTFDGSSTSLTNVPGKIDAAYGRCLTVVGSSGADHVCTIFGRDYLGQPMREQFTLSGATTQQGKKAFKYVERMTVAAGQAGDTVDVGWSDVLGLPYKSEKLLHAFQDGALADDEDTLHAETNTAFAIADSTSSSFTAPFDGYIAGWEGEYTTAMTSASSAITLTINGGSAEAAYTGVAPVGAIGAKFGRNVDASSRVAVSKGDTVALVSDGGGTAGVANMTVFFSRGVVDFIGSVETDPQTATTGDPRGTFKPSLACNGSRVFEAHLVVDIENLHGVRHYNG